MLIKFIINVVVKNEDVPFLMENLRKCSHKYSFIGLGLNFSNDEIKNIEGTYPRGSPEVFLNEILDQWTNWPTKDHPDHPTLEKLCEVLRSGLVKHGALSIDIYKLKDSLPSKKK